MPVILASVFLSRRSLGSPCLRENVQSLVEQRGVGWERRAGAGYCAPFGKSADLFGL